MESLKKRYLFSFGEKILIAFCILGFLLVVLTMPIFGMPHWYHLFVGTAALVFAVVSLIRWRHSDGPTGVLIGSVVATICFGIYYGFIVP